MQEKLKDAEKRYIAIEEELATPEVFSDQSRYASLMKDYKALTPVIEKYRKYCYNIIIKTEVKQNDYRRKNKILSSAKSDDAGKVSSRAYYILSGSFKMGEKDFP